MEQWWAFIGREQTEKVILLYDCSIWNEDYANFLIQQSEIGKGGEMHDLLDKWMLGIDKCQKSRSKSSSFVFSLNSDFDIFTLFFLSDKSSSGNCNY